MRLLAIPVLEDAMKEKTANLLATALVDTLEAAGLSAIEIVEGLVGTKVPTKYRGRVGIGYKAYFVQQFRKQPEPNKNDMAQTLATLTALRSAPHKIRSLMKQKLKEMPPPHGGAPRKIEPEEEKTVCAEIQAPRVDSDTREAIRQIARKRRVSERTIYRIWGKYYPKKKKQIT
jgi:hypothetical protein